MRKTRKPWREKLEHPPKGLPKVEDGPPEWEKIFGGRRVLVPTPLLVDGLIRKVPERKLVTAREIRERLAKDFNADSTCPLTTGIHIRIAAETAEEDLRNGREEITPYWRVVKPDGSLNEKFPGGTEAQAAHLRAEGHTVEPGKGKKPPRVKDFEKSLQRL
ncbi:MAG: MGMT family protein [Dehalococcoidia bacterium]|nr:MGMT family protein [Dehalococcoidia bacterium]